MKKYPLGLLAVPLAASMLLAGCGGDAKPEAPSSSTATSPPTTTPVATTASPTTAVPTADPNIPAAARAHTPAGAAAFVKYFFDQLNVAWGQPQAGLLAPLSLPGCKTCRAWEDQASNLLAKHQRVSGDAVRIDFVDPGGTEQNGEQRVIVTGEQLKTIAVDSNGKDVHDIPAAKIRDVATTRWTASGWRISEIKVLK